MNEREYHNSSFLRMFPNYIADDEERAKLRKTVVSHLRSILISEKGGVDLERIKGEMRERLSFCCVPPDNLRPFSGDYRGLIGEPIPWRALGHSTLEDFLDYGRDFCRVSYAANGGIILKPVVTADTAHIAHMVSQQRNVSLCI